MDTRHRYWTGLILLTSLPFLPTEVFSVPGAAVATLNIDAAGNISGTEARNVDGSFANETITGTWTVNPDCTGTVTAKIYQSGQLVRTSVLSVVLDDDLREVRMVQQSFTSCKYNSRRARSSCFELTRMPKNQWSSSGNTNWRRWQQSPSHPHDRTLLLRYLGITILV
jgi:hypothetical protein